MSLLFERTCRFCGCTDRRACVDPETGEACAWAAEDICSFCFGAGVGAAIANEDVYAAIQDFLLFAACAHEAAMAVPEYTPQECAEAAARYRECAARQAWFPGDSLRKSPLL